MASFKNRNSIWRGSIFLAAYALAAGSVGAQVSVSIPLAPDARTSLSTEWRYATNPPAAEWNQTAYDDVDWNIGFGGFGSGTVSNGRIKSDWSTKDIWMRKSFTLQSLNLDFLVLSIHHDDDVEVYLNGRAIFAESSYVTDYATIYLSDTLKSALVAGTNVLAVHCVNANGPQYIDAGLSGIRTMYESTLIGDSRGQPENWLYSTQDPGVDWNQPGFHDEGWVSDLAGFGSQEYSAYVRTPWTTSDIWLRKKIHLSAGFEQYLLTYHHDDKMEIFVNGVLAVHDEGWTNGFQEQVYPNLRTLLTPGDNLVAVHCVNDVGAQFIDVGLIGLSSEGPVALRRGLPRAANPNALYSGSDLDLTRFGTDGNALLEIFGLDGCRRAALRTNGRKSLPLPSNLGTGAFRYRWSSASRTVEGLLIRLR